MIYRCAGGHISFAKSLMHCGMKGCELSVDAISDADVEWFYKISPEGLAINQADLHMILEDKNMPKEVKEMIKQAFPDVKKKGFRFW
jgi:hypothetical protein